MTTEYKEISTLQSIAQERAKYAWECANRNRNTGKDKEEYASLVRKIPMYIKTNGLLNTLAFLYSKRKETRETKETKETREEQILNDITTWLTNTKFGLIDEKKLTEYNKNKGEALIRYLINAEPHTVIACTAEIMSLFTWLRRFVKDEDTNS